MHNFRKTLQDLVSVLLPLFNSVTRSFTDRRVSLWFALVGLVVASLVGIFWHPPGFSFVISALGVLIFAGLTAWDTQKLKEQYDYVAGDATVMAKASIMGALTLYLDFINLFQFLMMFLGQRRD